MFYEPELKSRPLFLHVKEKFFNQILLREKKEEYRRLNQYWSKRLMNANKGRYDQVVIVSGYPQKFDTKKWLEFQWSGITIKTITHPIFGSYPVEVFAIKLDHDIPEKCRDCEFVSIDEEGDEFCERKNGPWVSLVEGYVPEICMKEERISRDNPALSA